MDGARHDFAKSKMKEKIQQIVKNALKELNLPECNFAVDHPNDIDHGDYSANVAMVLSKQVGENPKALAEKIVAVLSRFDLDSGIEKVEVAGPGFINFYLSREFFSESIKEIYSNTEFGRNDLFSGKKIMIEYTQPNPFKPFHIGHLMSNSIGESIARIFAWSGAKVVHANYQGDVGPHVAKAMWALLKNGKGDESLSTEMQAEYIGRCYSEGATVYEDDPSIKAEIDAINKKIYDKSDLEINALYDWGRKVTLDAFETLYKTLGTKFEYYFFESEMAPIGAKIVRENIGPVFDESDGAVVFHAEKHDPKLHTRVFINSQGLPTYETKEIGLTITKFEKENPDLSIVTTAIEQGEYMKVVQKAISLIHPNYENRMKHITHGMMRFASGKMSSRKGNVVTGESLLRDSRDAILEKLKDRDFSEDEKQVIASFVGVASLKYSILKAAIGGDIVYDFDKSISFEGDSGPYLQYSYTRAKAVLQKAEKENTIASFENVPPEIFTLEKMLYKFPEVVLHSTEDFEPHYIATFLVEICREFNSFYAQNQIVNAEDQYSSYKIALTKSFASVVKNGLHLLGIQVPEKM